MQETEVKSEPTLRRDLLQECHLCPHQCGVNRLAGRIGFCSCGSTAVIYRFGPHPGEEPPISGWRGSGCVFFSGCPMGCLYCQNHKWSQVRPIPGEEYQVDDLARLFLKLQECGCHNVNLVTPEPWIFHIIDALKRAKQAGLRIPIVFNTSGFITPESLSLLRGVIDIYITDLRYGNFAQSEELSNCGSYFAASRQAVKMMWSQVGSLKIDSSGIARRGLIVRFLLIPGLIQAALDSLIFLAEEVSTDVHVSLLAQYEPVHQAGGHGELGRKISSQEYLGAIRLVKELGLNKGWKQKLVPVDPGLLGTEMERATVGEFGD